MSEYVPAEVFPPGDYIKEEMEARGWLQQDLADVIGRPLQAVNELITGKRAVTAETAQALEQAFGIDTATWLRLEAMWQAARIPPVKDRQIVQRGKLREKLPLREVLRRGWIVPTDDERALERRVLAFLEIATIDDDPPWSHAARKSDSYSSVSAPELAWVARCRHLARGVQVQRKFDATRRDQLVSDLRRIAVSPEESRRIGRVLADHGIRLVVVEKLANTRIDGACFWIGPDAPVIAISFRYDRIDYFWFTVLHELGHVFDGPSANVVESDLFGEHSARIGIKPESENNADRFAASALVDQGKLEDYIVRVGPLYSAASIRGFARLQQIHPGIVVGQLQFREELQWSQFRAFLVKVRDAVIPSVLTDGWGYEPPALIGE